MTMQDAAFDHSTRPRSRPSAAWSALLVCAIPALAVVAMAVLMAPDSYRPALAAGAVAAAAVLCAAVAAAFHYRDQAIRSRRQAAADAAQAAARIAGGNEAVARLAEESKHSEARRASAMAACASAAGRMQAMTASMLADLREMEDRHGDPKVLADLLRLDHRAAQAGRLADSIAVLSGARSGRRWAKPIAMESILRGAMGRVGGYQRIRLRAVTDVAIAGHAAEGVMHALAEFFDNACNFSPPTTEVHVYSAEVPAGAIITIEDSGLRMSQSVLHRAERAVSGAAGDLSMLSGTRLGLAVVGLLARKHGLTVSFRPSAIGGTAVVVMVPKELITRPVPVAPRQVSGRPAGGRPETPATSEQDPPSGSDRPAGDGHSASALPKRPRGGTLATAHPDGLPTDRKARDAVAAPSRRAPDGFSAFRDAFARREAGDTPPPPSSPSDPSEDDR
ncbi:sensor histidine kinase [Actinomadura sp. 9N407]|uniref:sensor histidine kinase n=1 Tax=Actinomadura sp. 9N407 TaxID=3375154 RepID=UPI0037B1D194